jgi:GNAT superfamily N-acetyltransferase
MRVRPLTPDDAPACDAIIDTLPTFFGVESGNQACAEAVRTERGFVVEDGGQVIAFLTYAPSTEETVEITWMAVRNDRRRGGAGRALIEALVDETAQPILVSTAGPSSEEPDADPDDNYEGTRRFYRRMGFVPVKELTPQGWGQPALFLVRFPDRQR